MITLPTPRVQDPTPPAYQGRAHPPSCARGDSAPSICRVRAMGCLHAGSGRGLDALARRGAGEVLVTADRAAHVTSGPAIPMTRHARLPLRRPGHRGAPRGVWKL